MHFERGIERTADVDLTAIQRDAASSGVTTFVLSGGSIVDRASFFAAVRECLPLDPELVGSTSWDALADSLWEGLYQHPSGRMAIVWPNAGRMAANARSDFEVALEVLEDVANLLSDRRATRDAPKELMIVVEVPVTTA